MELTADAAPQAPALRHNLRFEGSGGEYFKIWIVNLALTVATLGIFSAWAKVRSKRYFYGNSFIGSHSFDYHADPIRILIGRAIALVVLLAYGATAHFLPALVFVWGTVFLFATPWLVNSSLRFNARNTSYRNVRFGFEGTYGDAFGAYILWGLLAAITLFTTYPLARRARDHFNINNHTFGEKYFHAEIPGGGMYRIYLTALAFFVGFVAVAGSIFYFLKDAHLDWKNPVTAAPYFLILGGAYLFGLLFLTTYIGTSVFNLAINRTQLADRFQLESGLSPLQMTWIAFSNLAFVIVTLGLFWPWAQVRLARYRADHFAISGPADLAGFTSEFVTGQGAIGEEVASFFDIDIGL